ncbi:CDP-alcohol phosphatidyltransferase family protein [Halobium salinum]|uniref:CDP-alcohol phosphatidyltransferase family protein n=1 Tax=Halobium salinum TaxID=1364940 RepID=A0ABD5PCK4_9EURY|nr:CDP-alcohol phosphatidyltransferase family protein [Halobium salinum]
MNGETRVVGVRLRAEWVVVGLVALLVAVVGNRVVGDVAGAAAGRAWLFVAGGVLVYELDFLRRHLDRNGGRDGPVRASLGPANAVTLVRGMLYAVAGGFLLVPPVVGIRWLPGLCYGAGAALDFVDGWVARRTGRRSVLGAKLDLAFDTLGFLVVPLVGVAWGRLPVWYLALAVARYLFRAGEAYRRHRGRPVAPLPESRVRRPLAALQMAVITAALLPVLPRSAATALATVAMVPSLLVFGRDWLVVSGRLSSSGSTDEGRSDSTDEGCTGEDSGDDTVAVTDTDAGAVAADGSGEE